MTDLTNNPLDPETASPQPTNHRILSLCNRYIHDLNDLGNALRFIQLFGHLVRFVPSVGWFLFDGLRWHLDDSQQILALALSSLQSYRDDALALTDKDITLCKRLLEHAQHSASLPRLSALLTIASTLPGITVPFSTFDADPFLLTVLNGTLDLRTNTLSPHNPQHYLTHLIPFAYDHQAQSSVWNAFLARLTNHSQPLQHYLQRAIGYSLTGLTTDGSCFLLTGPGHLAQHLLLSLLTQLFGDAAASLPGFHHRYLTPSLFNARFLTASTPAFLHPRDYSALATLLEARPAAPSLPTSLPTPLLQPHGKLWLAVPDLPPFPTDFSYLHDYLALIPLSLSLSPNETRQLTQDLQAALPAILTWAVQGCLLWQIHTLQQPDIVVEAQSASREDQDDLASFLESCCHSAEDSHTTRAHDLYLAYTLWSRSQGTPRLSESAFGRRLIARGFRRDRQATGRFYHGLALNLPLEQLSLHLANTYKKPTLLSTPARSQEPTPTQEEIA